MNTNKPDEIIGRFASYIWRAPDGSALIGRITLPDGKAVVVKGSPEAGPGLTPGITYRFLGQWQTHERYGDQFAFAIYGVLPGVDRRGVVEYLKAVAPGVGDKRASALWDAFGPAAVETLRQRPEVVAATGIMTAAAAADAAKVLHNEGANEATKIELMGLLAGRGFPLADLMRECLRHWRTRAPEVIRRSPYLLLLRDLPGCGWKRCDKLYLDLGKSPTALKRQALCAVHHLRSESDGHTWHPAKRVGDAIVAAIGAKADPLRAMRLAIRARLLVCRKDAETWIAEYGKAKNEAIVAYKVKELRAWMPTEKGSARTSLAQRLAAAMTTGGSARRSTPTTSTTSASATAPNAGAERS